MAAYRERWNIGSDERPLGPESAARTIEAVGHRKRCQAALERALSLTTEARTDNAEHLSLMAVELMPEVDVAL